jgi:hypothetical protein
VTEVTSGLTKTTTGITFSYLADGEKIMVPHMISA